MSVVPHDGGAHRREDMKRKCRTHSAEFKAKVAVEAVMGKKLVTELTEQFDIHPIQIQD